MCHPYGYSIVLLSIKNMYTERVRENWDHSFTNLREKLNPWVVAVIIPEGMAKKNQRMLWGRASLQPLLPFQIVELWIKLHFQNEIIGNEEIRRR